MAFININSYSVQSVRRFGGITDQLRTQIQFQGTYPLIEGGVPPFLGYSGKMAIAFWGDPPPGERGVTLSEPAGSLRIEESVIFRVPMRRFSAFAQLPWYDFDPIYALIRSEKPMRLEFRESTSGDRVLMYGLSFNTGDEPVGEADATEPGIDLGITTVPGGVRGVTQIQLEIESYSVSYFTGDQRVKASIVLKLRTDHPPERVRMTFFRQDDWPARDGRFVSDFSNVYVYIPFDRFDGMYALLRSERPLFIALGITEPSPSGGEIRGVRIATDLEAFEPVGEAENA